MTQDLTKYLKPNWDGTLLSWPRFMKEWDIYWEYKVKENPMLLPSKIHIFADCLQGQDLARAKVMITSKTSFEDLIDFFARDVRLRAGLSSLTRSPAYQEWKNFAPSDTTSDGFCKWFRTWEQRAEEVGGLNEADNSD